MTATGTLLPANVDMTAVVGADFQATVVLYTDAAQTVPFDLTGYTATLQVSTLFTLALGSGLTVTTPANGTIVAKLTHAQTATAPPTLSGAGEHYTLQLTDGSGTISYPLVGALRFLSP